MSLTATATIFSSFNARALNPKQVAQTFVPSLHFEKLCQRRHTIILGPRGSGKTTLLKMLQQPALESWANSEADRYIGTVDFTGVFVATDISWGEQLSSLGHGQLEVPIRQLLGTASFTTHVLRSVVIAMQNRVRESTPNDLRRIRRVKLSEDAETRIVSSLAADWHLNGIIPTFAGLRQGLTRRLADIREIASKEMLLGPVGRNERLSETRFLHLDFLPSASSGIEVFDYEIGEEGAKWAFLFDELEIAPKGIQASLMTYLRSVDDRFLFKLALNPFTDNSEYLSSPTSAVPGQDFDQIALWYAEKRHALGFCQALWQELMKAQGLSQIDPVDVFGVSEFEAPFEEWQGSRNAYGPDSRWSRKFVSLAHSDPSFRQYLKERKIDPLALDQLTAVSRAAEVRKIAPIVAIREYFLRKDKQGPGTSKRSRKAPAGLYAGAESVFAITEGNPRWFLGLMRSMLSELGTDGTLPLKTRVPRFRQADEMFKAAQRFAATLRTIPVPLESISTQIGVLGLVKKVGEYFNDQAVRGPFRPEPPGSFTVDSNSSDGLLAVLEQALNAGAIVYVPDDDAQLILASLKGKRFRLTYMLAPIYEIPIRLGSSVSLRKIFEATQRTTDRENQDSLFARQESRNA